MTTTPDSPEPLFFLHCGKVDSSGEQDDWDVEANSGRAVEALAARHPGETLSLVLAAPAPAAPKVLTDERIEAFVRSLGARWDGSYWIIEDADLHPMVRAIIAELTQPLPGKPAGAAGER